MRRRDQDARSVPGQQRSGTIPRGELRRQLPPTDSSDWLILVVVGAIALAAVLAIAGVFDGPRPPAGAAGSGSPPGTAGGSAVAGASPLPTAFTPSVPATAAFTQPPTEPPTPSPTAPATPGPTARPTPSPTARPTSRPSPSARATPTAAAPSASPRPTTPTGGLTILEPADGVVVDDRSIVIRGIGPPGAVITRDIPFWFDEHARADAAGRWSFTVELVPGDNKLTFRVADDVTTSRTLTVRFEPD